MVKVKEKIIGYKFERNIPEYIFKEMIEKEIVCIIEDEAGIDDVNFYVTKGKKEINFGKPLTTHLIFKFDKTQSKWWFVTRHNYHKKFGIYTLGSAALIVDSMPAMSKKIIWKDEELYREFEEEIILEKI